MDTERGESIRLGVRRGEGRVAEGDALYRGGVIVSVIVVAMGVISKSATLFRDDIPEVSRPINSR